MELLVVLVVLAVLFLMAFGIFGFAIIGLLAKENKKSVANAPATLKAAFDGRDTVTFTVSGLVGLNYEDVVLGAQERGYRLTHDSGRDRYGGQTLIFERA